MSRQDGFFAVGRASFIRACSLGINPAAVFLVIASGSGADNVSSRWSAEAASRRLQMRWTKANEAIRALTKAKLIRRDKTAKQPSYKIDKKGDLIWLPNTLVDGADGETPPIARVRQTQDAMCLRLLIELYGEQNLREDGGISPNIVRTVYERHRAGARGPYTTWAFTKKHELVTWTETMLPHRRSKLTPDEIESGANHAVDFFRRLGQLEALGLVQWVPYLYDGPDGEPMHPIWRESDVPEERMLSEVCERAAQEQLTPAQMDYLETLAGYDVLAPARAHIQEVMLIGIARLRYRPRTSLTAAWWAETKAVCERYTREYEALLDRVV